ncbi:hypothetical protein PInf_017503 [Phytophthora infestans]|nr:hypothetical protein PInf_017503 [Phytophthora infestans]
MEFNAIWPLLRKEKWTWKAGTGIQIQYVHLLVLARIRANEVILLSIASHNYVKPGRKVRGGKQGVDYFGREDALLGYVRSDKELCAKPHISSVIVRPKGRATVGPSDDNNPPGHYRGQSTLGKAPAKKSVMPVVPAKRLADASSKKPAKKKKTKKQLTEEASARRREMAAFDKVWGHQTSSETRNAVVTISDEIESQSKEDDRVEGIDDSADEGYSPANDKESDDEDDVGTYKEQRERVELQGDIEEPNQLLRSSGGNAPLRFDYVDTLDPNIANAAGQTELDTDGEGDEDTAEADFDADSESDASDAEICKSDMLQHDIRRVPELMNNAERDRLHLRIQESLEVYTDEQLDQMKIEGWKVLPDNVKAEVVDDPDVDTMYARYCGPSQDIIAASKSPLKLFYYYLPKSFWRQVANSS